MHGKTGATIQIVLGYLGAKDIPPRTTGDTTRWYEEEEGKIYNDRERPEFQDRNMAIVRVGAVGAVPANMTQLNKRSEHTSSQSPWEGRRSAASKTE